MGNSPEDRGFLEGRFIDRSGTGDPAHRQEIQRASSELLDKGTQGLPSISAAVAAEYPFYTFKM
jgi:hypothetical protein